jgi:S1-C subfamily serine protease
MEAVVGLQVTAAEDARSAETLGREREGSGVVIGSDGLILTIGYLILEADSIQVTTHDNRVIPARPVGYDQATGFGLVRPVLPLRGIQPVALGNAQELAPRSPLLAATGGDDGGMGLTQLVGTRAFSGYWEYHIEKALFTSPPLRNHSGASLFNQRGELLGSAACSSATPWAMTTRCQATCSCRWTCSSRSWPKCSRPAARA